MDGRERYGIIRDELTSEATLKSLHDAAVVGVSVDRYVRLLLSSCARSSKLLGASIDSLKKTALDSVALGLPVGSVLGYAYAVPYKGRAQLQVGYQGLLRLAYNDGRATMACAELVREGDKFEYILGTDPYVSHVPLLGSSSERKAIAAYSVIASNGPPFVTVASIEDLDAHARQYVRTNEKGEYPADALYRTNPVAWYKKTVLRRNLKFVPMSERARSVVASEDYIEQGLDTDDDIMQSGDEQTTSSLRAALGIPVELEDEDHHVEGTEEDSADLSAVER